MVAVLCALASGVGFYFSLQLGAQWWLAWLAPIPLLWLAYSGAPRLRVAASCWAAMAIGLCNMLPAYWGLLPAGMLASSILLSGVLLALLVLGSAFVARRLSPLAGTLAFAALYTGADYLLTTGVNGAAASWANSQVGMPVLIQSASLFGPWAIDFVLTVFAAGVAMTLATGARAPAVAAVLVFAANLGFGLWRLAAMPLTPVVHVALAAYDHHFAAAAPALEAYEQAAGRLARDRPSLIVFPEKIAVLDATSRALAVTRLRAAAARAGAVIVMGFDDESSLPAGSGHGSGQHGGSRVAGRSVQVTLHDSSASGADPRREAGRPHNSALVSLPDGSVLTYDKRHMVPGLEDRFAPGRGGFVLGDGTGVAICKDMDFPAMLRGDAARLHPTLLAVPAWDFAGDAWWHARLAILRGVENGFAVVRSARNGLMTISDAYGQVLGEVRSGAHPMGLLAGTVARGPGPTLYTRLGDVFAQAALALAAILLGWAALRRRQRLAPGTQSTSPLAP